jgi:hypothetical protein
MTLRGPAFAFLFALATGCASFAIDLPKAVTLRVGAAAEIDGGVANARTPVGDVSVVEGELPPGLTLEHGREAEVFSIRGTPTAAGRYEVDICAWTYGTNFPGDRETVRLVIDVVE